MRQIIAHCIRMLKNPQTREDISRFMWIQSPILSMVPLNLKSSIKDTFV